MNKWIKEKPRVVKQMYDQLPPFALVYQEKNRQISACMLSLRSDLPNSRWKSMSSTPGVTDTHVIGSPLKITFWPIQK